MNKENGENGSVPVHLLIEEMKSRGYALIERTATVCVLEPADPNGHAVVFPGSDPYLSDALVRHVLRDEPVDADEIIDAVCRRIRMEEADRDQEEQPFKIDVDAALRVLETTPHPRHRLDPQTKGRVRELLEKVDSEEGTATGIADASENLDKYIY